MNRFLPAIVFVVTTGIGLAMSAMVYQSVADSSQSRFSRIAVETAGSVKLRVEQHISLLRATNSFFEASSDAIDRYEFRTFVEGLDTERTYDGIQGIGFAKLISTGTELVAEQQMRRDYDLTREIWPVTDQPVRTAIALLEPANARNRTAIGYDMFADEVRREAMIRAFKSGEPAASGPVELVQEITTNKQVGFLVYLYRGPKEDLALAAREGGFGTGFVYAPFRAGDLHSAALMRTAELPVVLESFDVTDGAEVALYRSPGHDDDMVEGGERSEIVLDVAGRKWKFVVSATNQFREPYFEYISPILAGLTILLAGALAATTHAQFKSIRAAQELNRVSNTALQQKELMLGEMKHRIKNSIARIMAIARQAANGAESLDEFKDSFSARLQAMATAQDALTRSHWERADLRELLLAELKQVFGETMKNYELVGPPVNVNEKAAQSLGLTFHELATNALKYGLENADDGIAISWSFNKQSKGRVFTLLWREKAGTLPPEPDRVGFGTRLMRASVGGELGGTFDRTLDEHGLTVRIEVPAKNLT
ncbi:CHASE domain-containing protein [Tepidamorphus sp. 3E244]|uniref:CHASE domain-containing protein n=1 Tax=Tepidamorphus sp. 3E244 TaxID=3385498 RepID=UPI0038FC833C